MNSTEEIHQYLEELTARVQAGAEYCSKNPDNHPAKRLLRELEYREVWTKRYLSHLENLNSPDTFGYEVYIMSPFARFTNILAVMLGTRSGIEDENFIANLAYYVATDVNIMALEHLLAAFDSGYSMTPDELHKTISGFAIQGYQVWLNFRKQITNI